MADSDGSIGVAKRTVTRPQTEGEKGGGRGLKGVGEVLQKKKKKKKKKKRENIDDRQSVSSQ